MKKQYNNSVGVLIEEGKLIMYSGGNYVDKCGILCYAKTPDNIGYWYIRLRNKKKIYISENKNVTECQLMMF